MDITVTRNAPLLSAARSTPASRARRRARPLAGAAAVCLIAVGGYAFTADQRGYYSDDFVNHARALEYGCWGACGTYFRDMGLVRPLQRLWLVNAHTRLWDRPALQQAMMITLHLSICLLLCAFVHELTRNMFAAVTAGAIFAAWHSYTEAVVWVAAAVGMLPGTALLLASLWLFVRYLQAPRPTHARRYWWASLILFGVSLLFYDQQIATVVVFSALAWSENGRKRSPPRSGPDDAPRERTLLASPASALAWTIPFWAVAGLIGAVDLATAAGTIRPLAPTVGGAIHGIGPVIAQFLYIAAAPGMIDQWLHRWGAPGAFYALDRSRLLLSLASLSCGGALLWTHIRQVPNQDTGRRSCFGRLALIGLLLTFTSLAIMASREPGAVIQRRHTLLPALGLAMALAAAAGTLRGSGWPRTGGIAVVAMVAALSVLRLGYVYEWTIRSRVTDRVLASLASLCPNPSENDVIVIDGLWHYGRGFDDTWGLSSAFSLDRGVKVRVTTMLQTQGDRLIAAGASRNPWTVAPDCARFFLWDESSQCLKTSNADAYRARHPELEGR